MWDFDAIDKSTKIGRKFAKMTLFGMSCGLKFKKSKTAAVLKMAAKFKRKLIHFLWW